jgi:hypothetical protein
MSTSSSGTPLPPGTSAEIVSDTEGRLGITKAGLREYLASNLSIRIIDASLFNSRIRVQLILEGEVISEDDVDIH